MAEKQITLRDKFWLWGHPEGRYNHMYKALEGKLSRMTPMEGCAYLGVNNVFMVPVGIGLDRRQYNTTFRRLNEVAWECYDAASDPKKIEPFIEEAKDFKNIGSVVFDDFIRGGEYKKIPLENLWQIRERLHNNEVRELNMWMVLYTNEFGTDPEFDNDFARYMEPFDGITMWTWNEKDVNLIPERFETLKKMAPNKRYLCGCYLWNFGDGQEATREAVEWQLNWYREKIYQGELEGVILHTNTMGDLGLDAYAAACEWMDKYGDEPYPVFNK